MTALTKKSELHETLNHINKQLKQYTTSDGQYKTNCEFRFNPAYVSGMPIKIHTCNDVALLISILGYLVKQKEAYDKAAEIIGANNYPNFTWMGYGYELWEHDIKLRYNIITVFEKVNKLKLAKQELEKFLTNEDKLSLVLSTIQTELGITVSNE
jgi:hypothetical protein